MDLNQARAFLAVAEELHFGRAAERLHMTQPPLSRTIRNLESLLSAQLFVRSPSGVSLTQAGRALIPFATRMVDASAMAHLAVNTTQQTIVGRVRFGFAGPSTLPLATRLVSEMYHYYPDIELSLKSLAYGPRALEDLVDGSLDLALVRWNYPRVDLDYIEVRQEKLAVALPTQHRLAQQQSVTISDIANETFISSPTERGSLLADAISIIYESGGRPDLRFVAPDTWTALGLVSAGGGIALILDSVVSKTINFSGIVIIPIEDHPLKNQTLRLAWHRKREGNDSLIALTVDVAQRTLIENKTGD